MENETNQPNRNPLKDIANEYKRIKSGTPTSENNEVKAKPMDVPSHKPPKLDSDYVNELSKETDPDLITVTEIVKLPSKGLYYPDGLSEVEVEYLTSTDEDILTTPSLIESGAAIEKILKRKIKTKNVNPNNLLPGDRSAIMLFLRITSYGADYTVEVTDPRTGKSFKQTVDLLALKPREIKEMPDEQGHFNIFLPMRKKNVKIKLLTYGEEIGLQKQAESLKEAYEEEYSRFNSLRIKSSVISVEGKTDRGYISKFIDVLPAGDIHQIRKKISEVSPDIDLKYRFKAKDGFEFDGYLMMGLDFFFPGI